MPSGLPVAKRPRVLVLLDVGDAYASGIVRGLVYREHFATAGYEAIFMNRRSQTLARLVHRPPHLLAPITSSPPATTGIYGAMEVVSRVTEHRVFAVAKTCDVVYMSKVRSLRFVRALRAATSARLILDFGDSLWLLRDGDAFNEVLRTVDAVTTDNEYTARHVRRFNPNCTVIFDTPQVEEFDRQRERLRRKASGEAVTIGWIGSSNTAFNLFVAWPALERVFRRHPNLRLRLVGAPADPRLLPPFEHVRWSARPAYDQAGMIEEVLGFDIGLFPMFHVENSVVRGVLKATVYMAGEAASISSPIGQVPDVIRDGENGFLASSDDEWEEKLERLISDAPLRTEIAARGLDTVRETFTVAASFSILKRVIDEQLGRGPAR